MYIHTKVLPLSLSLFCFINLSPLLSLWKVPNSECDHSGVLNLGALPGFLICLLVPLKLFTKENSLLGNILVSILSRERQPSKCSINVCWVRRKWNLSVQLQRKLEPEDGGLCSEMCTWWICLNFSLVFTAVTFMRSQQTNESASLVV